ncbi:hypothetical protein MY4824_007199 [Beauveria thailandica]
MSDPMDIDDKSAGEQSAVPMSISDDNQNNQNLGRWCLSCAVDAGQPGKQPCECPPEEGAAGRFRSVLEDEKRRICNLMQKKRDQMEDLMRRFAQKMPRDSTCTKCIKYEQQILHFRLGGVLQFTNHDSLLHDNGDRMVTVRKFKDAKGKWQVAFGDPLIGYWVPVIEDLDDVPRYQELVEFNGKGCLKALMNKIKKKRRPRPPPRSDDPVSSSA